MLTEKKNLKKQKTACLCLISVTVCSSCGSEEGWKDTSMNGGKREDRFGKNGKRQSNPHSKICLILTQCCSFPHLFLSVFVWLFSCALLIIFASFSHLLLLWFCSVSFPPLLFVFLWVKFAFFQNLSSFIHASSLFLCSPSSLLWFVINPLFCLRLSPEGFARNPLITLCLLKPLKN